MQRCGRSGPTGTHGNSVLDPRRRDARVLQVSGHGGDTVLQSGERRDGARVEYRWDVKRKILWALYFAALNPVIWAF